MRGGFQQKIEKGKVYEREVGCVYKVCGRGGCGRGAVLVWAGMCDCAVGIDVRRGELVTALIFDN